MEWKIVQCDYLEEHAGKNKVINNVHWEVVKTDGEYMGRSYGSVAIPVDDLSSFVEFDSLNEEAVIAWAKGQLGDEQVTEQESSVTDQINEQKNPTKGSGVPW